MTRNRHQDHPASTLRQGRTDQDRHPTLKGAPRHRSRVWHRGVLRALLWLCLISPAAALAEAYHDIGQPDQCGTYAEAAYDRESWFGGGEGGVITLADPQAINGLNAVLFDGVISDEGFSDPAGRVLAMRGPLLTSDGTMGVETLVIQTETGVRVLQPCP